MFARFEPSDAIVGSIRGTDAESSALSKLAQTLAIARSDTAFPDDFLLETLRKWVESGDSSKWKPCGVISGTVSAAATRAFFWARTSRWNKSDFHCTARLLSGLSDAPSPAKLTAGPPRPSAL